MKKEDEMRMEGGGYLPPPINNHDRDFGWGPNNYLGGGEPGPYERREENINYGGGRGGHFLPNFPGHPPPPNRQPPLHRRNPHGDRSGDRREGYNNY